jgi:hypothetical protein
MERNEKQNGIQETTAMVSREIHEIQQGIMAARTKFTKR